MPQNSRILLVGCGGTGSFVAEGLCRILPADQPLLLIDHDRVEPHNLRRQNYYEGDVGKFKSQALAERLARQFGRRVAYSVYPFNREIVSGGLGGGLHEIVTHGIIIGCVDNADARIEIERCIQFGSWWIDAGNGPNSGQVLIGNTNSVLMLEDSFDKETMTVVKLPAPSMQLPSLLIPQVEPPAKRMDCAEAVEADEQSPIINQAMASLTLEFVHRLLQGTLTWMAAYIDLDVGTLQTIPAEPVTIAKMFSVKVDTLIAELDCSVGLRYRLQERR